MILALLGIVAQLNISVRAPDSALVNEPFVVSVIVSSPSLLPPTVTAPRFPGLSVVGTSDVSTVIGEGRARHVIVQKDYHVVASAENTITIGAFEAQLGGVTMRSPPFKLSAYAPRQRQVVIGRGSTIDSLKSVSVVVTGTPDTVFVGQQATYQVAVYVDEAYLRQRTARNPTFTPPDLRGTLSYELPGAQNLVPPRQVGSRTFRPHVYQRAIFPLVPGKHVVPAAMLDYAVPVAGSFFSKEEIHSLRADSVIIVARPLPTAGRPEGFAGAVGSYKVERSMSGLRLRVGDPITMHLRVIGTGNIKLLPRPSLNIPWADVLADGETIELDLKDGRVRGTKDFTWVVTPRSPGLQEIPEIRYPYFEPGSAHYQIALASADTIEITPGSLLASDDSIAAASSALAIRSEMRGDAAPLLWKNPFLLVILVVAPLPALAVLALKRKKRNPRVLASANVPHRPSVAVTGDAAALATARRQFLASVEERLGMSRGVVATEGGFRSALLRGGVSRETAAEAERIAHALDVAVFGAGAVPGADLIESARKCFRRIDAEATERKRVLTGNIVPVVVLLVGSLWVQGASGGNATFREGVRLYANGSYTDAAEKFLAVTRVRQRAPDAWTNLGAAAWESGDTAAAMIAWQRALRLEPTAFDVRANIEAMPQSGSSDAALVIPAPPNSSIMVAAFLWVATWILIFFRVSGLRRIPGLLLTVCAVLAVAVGAFAFEVNRRVVDPDIAVITHGVITHALPSLESGGLTRLSAGEVVRLVRTERDWSRVTLDGQIAGWVHHNDLLRVVID